MNPVQEWGAARAATWRTTACGGGCVGVRRVGMRVGQPRVWSCVAFGSAFVREGA